MKDNYNKTSDIYINILYNKPDFSEQQTLHISQT